MQINRTIRVGGWVKTGREAGAGAFAFLEVNDGSTFESLQVRAPLCFGVFFVEPILLTPLRALKVMLTKEVAEAMGTTLSKLVATGTSVLVEGELAATPEGTKQVSRCNSGHIVKKYNFRRLLWERIIEQACPRLLTII